MFSGGVFVRFWDLGSFLHDGVRRHQAQESRGPDWMISRSSLFRAIFTGEVSMPLLVEVNSNIVGVWPLLVVYIRETGKRQKADGDSSVL